MSFDKNHGDSDDIETNKVTTTTKCTPVATSAPQETYHVDGLPVLLRTDFKQEHTSFCAGGCCTLRQAVIVVNLVNIICIVVGTSLTALTLFAAAADRISHKDSVVTIGTGSILFCAIVSINLLGIYGALKYNSYLVGTCGSLCCVIAALFMMDLKMVGMVYYGFFALPHFFCMREVQKQIINDELDLMIHDDDSVVRHQSEQP